MRTRRAIIGVFLVSAAWLAAPLSAASPAAEPTGPDLQRLSRLLREMILIALPHEYENTKHWGRTKEVWDGLKISFDGLRIKTKRRKKAANHGTWKKYQAWLIRPQENLQVELSELYERDDGRIEFVLTVRTPLGAFGRLSEWRRDVQLYSFSIQAEGYVSLRMRCDMALALSFQHFPPDLLLDPVVSDADLRLVEFKIKRISDFSGPLVRELGEGLHEILNDEIHKRRAKIVAELNQQIDKNRRHLTVSVHELLRWDKVQELMEDAGSNSASP